MKKISLFILFILSITPVKSFMQDNDSIDYVVYLIGNTATKELDLKSLDLFSKQTAIEKHPFAIIHLGDILKPGSLESSVHELNYFFNEEIGSMADIYFIPGDKEWDNAGRNGLATVRKTEDQIEKQLNGSNIFLPSRGCPGPEIIDLSPTLRLIAINSHWWMHPFDIPEAPDSDCENITREEFLESLDEIIEESIGMNIIIAGHHPVISNGVYGGHMPLRKHIFPLEDKNPDNHVPIPLLGSFYAAYRQNIGTVRDMANEDYREFTDRISDILEKHPGLIYTSAHDYSLQLLEIEEGYQVISGSLNEKEPVGRKDNALFSSSKSGFGKLVYYTNGNVGLSFYQFDNNRTTEIYSKLLLRSACVETKNDDVQVNRFFIPCYEDDMGIQSINVTYPSGPVTVSGGDYQAGPLKKLFLGSLYRSSWITPVNVPYMNLDTVKSGLTPFALGGGRQTTTLKFKAGDGKEYAFRSVDKNLINALPREYQHTLISTIVQNVTATQHPYGALVVSSLLDGTDILHARPTLYVLPDHPRLGAYREAHEGLFGMLEVRPKDPVGDVPGFMGADDVTRSVGLFRKLYKDNDNSVDAISFGRARAFDIFIGDWGRHEDNWKWAGYELDNRTIYYPIPRDRDHAFSKWDGILPKMADRKWAMPMIENFNYDFHDIQSLTWPGRHVDRLLLTSLEREDWAEISAHIQSEMTEDVINKAIASMPPKIQSVSGTEIGSKLKSRREQLPGAVDDFYLLLAKYVDVVASNKHEHIQVERLSTGNVRVTTYKKDKDSSIISDVPLFEREFVRGETREIRIYGLDGQDVFNVSGSSNKSILVRLIGGPGEDEIVDRSSVRGLQKHTYVYDNIGSDLTIGRETKNKSSDDAEVNTYDRKSFTYNTYVPKPLIYYTPDDGFVASMGINWTTHGFRKEEYKSNNNIYIRAGTSGNIQLGGEMHLKSVLGKWDLGISADYGRYFPYYNFFGIGNNTVKDPELYESDYYKTSLKGLVSKLHTEREIFREGTFRIGILAESYDSDNVSDSLLDFGGQIIPGAERFTTTGFNTRFYLDLRDRKVFATRGIEMLIENTSYLTIDGISGDFGMAESFLKYYGTTRLLIPTTLVLKVGGSKNYGSNIPYYKYSFLGQDNNLRGYRKNRFIGDASAYFNSELRFHFGKIKNLILPFETGLIGFYDLGKVWFEGDDTGGWHSGYGGGFYVAPLKRDYLLSIMLESSSDESILFRFGFGFILDR
jgi:hypothetical protein